MSSHHPSHRLLPLLLVAPLLLAFDYGSAVIVSTEEDIYELFYADQIDEEQRNLLVKLLSEPLDLNEASREDLQLLPDITYAMADEIIARRAQRPFASEAELIPLLGWPVWRQIRAFATVSTPGARSPSKKDKKVSAVVTTRVLNRLDDDKRPVSYIKAKAKYAKWVEGGVIVAEQDALYGADYTGTAPVFDGYGPRVELKRAFIAAKRLGWSAIAGHYGVGFGQRLVFDETDDQHPDGFKSDLQVYEDSESYDSLSTSKRLLGLAGTVTWPLGSALKLSVTAWSSANTQDLYYTDTGISRSTIGILDGEVPDYPTLPQVYREDLAGLHAALSWWERDLQIGVTGYGGRAVKAFDYDFSSYDIPNRAAYGALGIDSSWTGNAHVQLNGEAALTDTGGAAARVESVLKPPQAEITLAFRYYGVDFDNPHSRGSSQPDTLSFWDPTEYAELEGDTQSKRDRDELGPQMKFVWDPLPWLRWRYNADIWQRLTQGAWNATTDTAIRIDPLKQISVNLLGSYTDKDLSGDELEPAYTSCGDDTVCQGRKMGAAAGLDVAPVEPLLLQGYYKEGLERDDDPATPWIRERTWWAKATWDITDDWQIAARYKNYEDHVRDEPSPTQKYWSLYGQMAATLPGRVKVSARYERRRYHMDSTERPTPEQLIKFGLEWRT